MANADFQARFRALVKSGMLVSEARTQALREASDYNNDPMGLREWLESQRRRNGFWRRLYLCLGVGLRWSATEWEYPSLYGISTASYPKWEPLSRAATGDESPAPPTLH